MAQTRPTKPYRQNVDRRETTEEGHDVKWDLTINNLQHLQSWPFEKNYRTLCETTPSTWRYKMWVPEVRDDGTCLMTVILERKDSLNIELEACIWVDICDPNDNIIFPKQTFSKSGFLPGESLQETVEIAPRPNMRDAINRHMIVCSTLMICFCHSDSE